MRAAFAVIFLTAVSQAAKQDFRKYASECVNELGIKTNEKGYPDLVEVEQKCFARCLGLIMKTIDENGNIIEDNIPERVKMIWKECEEKVKETDSCKRANEMMKCARPRHGGNNKYLKLMQDCVKELDIKTNDKGFPDKEDATNKCFAQCVLTRGNLIDDNGNLLENNIPGHMKMIFMECDETIQETDVCKRANEMLKCVMPKRKDDKMKMRRNK